MWKRPYLDIELRLLCWEFFLSFGGLHNSLSDAAPWIYFSVNRVRAISAGLEVAAGFDRLN